MNRRAVGWGLAFIVAGLAVAFGWLPGASQWAGGPRAGLATGFLMLGITVLLAGNAAWILRRTTKAEDYRGGCPVGATCKCGHFNFKPRKVCRECGASTAFA